MKTMLAKPIILIFNVLILSNLIVSLGTYSAFGAQLDEDILEARMRFQEAYNATVEVEKRGVDLTEVKERLNNALDYIIKAERVAGQGDTELADLWIKASTQECIEILSLVERLQQTAENSEKTKLAIYLTIIFTFLILGFSVVFLGKRIYRRYKQKKLMKMKLKAGRIQR